MTSNLGGNSNRSYSPDSREIIAGCRPNSLTKKRVLRREVPTLPTFLHSMVCADWPFLG